MKIILFTTGGSIDKTYSPKRSDFVVAGPAALDLLNESGSTLDIEIVPLLRKDSLEITDADRDRIAAAVNAADSDHIVITHGTDTLVETARRLDGIPGKVIVLTGAMKPAAFRDSDAPFNLGGAIAAVQILKPGVYITFNGRVFPAENVKKNMLQDRFEPESDDSGSSNSPCY